MKKKFYLLFFYLFILHSYSNAQNNDLPKSRLKEIRSVLDTALFVNRMETIETPCMCIDMNNDKIAHANRVNINSNYRIQLSKDSSIDPDGIKCLSQYVSRYMKFHVIAENDDSLTMQGEVSLSYAYPAGSIMQYLGFTQNQLDKDEVFFKKLISSKGTFSLYPQGTRFMIRMSFSDAPFKSYTMFGYLEIVREAYRDTVKSFRFFFDQLSIKKGNNNNSISVKFSNTTHYYETEYFTVFIYHLLKESGSPDAAKRAYALWLRNYLQNMNCSNLSMFISAADTMIRSDHFTMPNTEPLPVN
jgi:hypothetical protein